VGFFAFQACPFPRAQPTVGPQVDLARPPRDEPDQEADLVEQLVQVRRLPGDWFPAEKAAGGRFEMLAQMAQPLALFTAFIDLRRRASGVGY